MTVHFAGIAARRQKVWLEATQNRLSKTADALKSLKVVKMTGLAEVASKTINDLRNREIKSSTMYRTMLIVVVVLCKQPILGLLSNPVSVANPQDFFSIWGHRADAHVHARGFHLSGGGEG